MKSLRNTILRTCFWGTLAGLMLTLSACQTAGRDERIAHGRPGQEVNSICFTRNIDGWHRLDDRHIVVRHRRNDYYRIEVLGGCSPRDAFLQVQLESRSGICLNRGDRIRFPNDLSGISCSVGRIHEWHLADPTDLPNLIDPMPDEDE